LEEKGGSSLELRRLEDELAALRAANQRLMSIIELLPDATLVIDNEKKVTIWNQAAEELTGVPKDEILGQGDYAYALPFFRARRPILIDLLDTPTPEAIARYKYVRREGDKIFCESYIPHFHAGKGAHLWGVAAPLFDSHGQRFGTVEVVRDFTELKQTEECLEGSVSLLQAVLDAAAEGILAVEIGGRIRSYNRQFVDLWGLDEEILKAQDNRLVIAAIRPKVKDPEAFQRRIEELYSKPEATAEDRIELLDGRVFERHSLPQYLGKDIVGRVWSFRDVTQRLQAERALRQSEELFKVVFLGIPGLAAIIDLCTGRFIEVNDGCERLLGWRREEILGRTATQLPIWPSRAECARFVQQVEMSQEITDMELELLRKDGQPCLFSGAARRVEIAHCRGAVLLLRDITERKRAERARAQLAAIIEGSSDAIIGMDLDGFVTAWNAGAERLYGYTAEEAIGGNLEELIGSPRAELASNLSSMRQGRSISYYETKRRAKDGSCRDVSMTLSPIRDDAGRVVGGSAIVRNLSERLRFEEELRNLNAALEQKVQERTAQLQEEICKYQRAEESLRLSEHKYRELVQSANSIILRMDMEGRVRFLNEFGQSFFGFRENEILGRSVVGTIVPETETSGRDLKALMGRLARHPEEYVVNENENIRCDGERVWIAWTNRPVLDGSGKLVESLCVGNDITALKNIERELLKAKEAAESADRLKSVFLATMSHELRTPLNSIIGFTGILMQGLAGALNPEQSKQLGMVQTSARHLLSLINDVLDLSKIEAGQLSIQRALFDVRAAVARVVEEVRPLADKKGLALRAQLAPEVGEWVSDQRRVEQVLVNLLSNAIKFTERGEVEVTGAIKNGQLEMSVRDTGIGIKPEDQVILFRPFQQVDIGLTRKHEGTGLGLSISRKLLQLVGGSITFSSTFGLGSVFSFRLPPAPEAQP
jgi:PAS domain S-box-containing protein